MKTYGCLKRSVRDKNQIILYDTYAEILLYNKEGNETARTKIDIDKVEKIKNIKWRYDLKNHYVVTGSSKQTKFIHAYLINIPKGMVVDHIDRNRLNNLSSNLRLVTYSQNGMNKGKQSNNTSGIVGVSWDKSRNKWEAHIKINKKKLHLGRFKNKEDAINARKEAEIKYFGEYRCKNPNINTVFKNK